MSKTDASSGSGGTVSAADKLKLTKSPRIGAYKSPMLTASFDQTNPLLQDGAEFTLDGSIPAPSADGSADLDLKGEPDRYQLFVNESNGFCHAVSIAVALKGVQELVYMNSARLSDDCAHSEDRVCGSCDMQLTKIKVNELAVMMMKLFDDKKTFPLPLLYDVKTQQVVSTESDVIMRFVNMAFNDCELCASPHVDLSPPDADAQKKLEKAERKYCARINACIGLAGRASSGDQFAFATRQLVPSLQKLENLLRKSRFVCGPAITEADVIEFVALVRFDPLLSPVFSTSLLDGDDDVKNNNSGSNGNQSVVEPLLLVEQYPCIFAWLQDIYQMDGVADVTDLMEIAHSKHYRNSFGVRLVELDVPPPPDNWEEAYIELLCQRHGRRHLGGSYGDTGHGPRPGPGEDDSTEEDEDGDEEEQFPVPAPKRQRR